VNAVFWLAANDHDWWTTMSGKIQQQLLLLIREKEKSPRWILCITFRYVHKLETCLFKL